VRNNAPNAIAGNCLGRDDAGGVERGEIERGDLSQPVRESPGIGHTDEEQVAVLPDIAVAVPRAVDGAHVEMRNFVAGLYQLVTHVAPPDGDEACEPDAGMLYCLCQVGQKQSASFRVSG
jgi:hypothetical protein